MYNNLYNLDTTVIVSAVVFVGETPILWTEVHVHVAILTVTLLFKLKTDKTTGEE